MADYPIEDDRSLYRVTCSGSLSLGNAHVWQIKPVGKHIDDGESSNTEQAVLFWAWISLQLWMDKGKQYVCLYFQMFFTEALILLEAFPHQHEVLHLESINLLPSPASPPSLFSAQKC